MKARCFLFTAYLFASVAQAKPTLFCSAEQWKTVPLSEDDAADTSEKEGAEIVSREIVHGDWKLRPTPDGQTVGGGWATFKAGGLKMHVSIDETLSGQTLKWKPHLEIFEGKTQKLLKKADADSIRVPIDDKNDVLIYCDIYEKTILTETLTLMPREHLRVDRLGGPGVTREYTRKNPTAYDLFDLFELLERVPGAAGDFFRHTVGEIFRAGGVNVALSANWSNGDETRGEFDREKENTVCQDPEVPAYRCDIENFAVLNSFWVPSDTDNDFHSVEVKGVLHRDSSTRRIRRFEIESVSVSLPHDERGGGSNSSGGRLNGSSN